MSNEEETAKIQQVADKIQQLCAGLANQLATPAHMIAALELVETRLTLALPEDAGDEIRALAADLFDSAATAELEAYAAKELQAWSAGPFDDVPIPYLVSDPTDEKNRP